MYSGLGGFENGIQQAIQSFKPKDERLQTKEDGGSINSDLLQRATCVGYSEIDKYAVAVYKYNYGEDIKNYGNADEINAEELPDFDCLVGGFPCQSFSIAGKRQGFEDTRGTQFFNIARIVKQKQPRLLVLENVKGLLSHDEGRTFLTILSTLDELGYNVEWQVLNSKNHGVPQNRERVFIIGHLRTNRLCRQQVFPLGRTNQEDTRHVGQDVSYALDANYHKGTNTLEKGRRQIVQVNNPTHSNDRVYSDEGISPTLNSMQGGNRQPFVAPVLTPNRPEKRQNGRRIKDHNEPSLTLTGQDQHGVLCHCLQTRSPDGPSLQKNPKAGGSGHIYKRDESYCLDTGNTMGVQELPSLKIRRLTPKECERLQGFEDNHTKYGIFDGEIKEISDTQRYKMCGNAVTTNVVRDVFEQIKVNDHE